MPAPIINGLITLISQELSTVCWDGEVPRYDTAGNAINPQAGAISPKVWPVVKVYMKEPGFTREWTTEDPYTDTGTILIQIWGTTRLQIETLMDSLETLLAQASKWNSVVLGGHPANPYSIISLLLTSWYSGQEEGVRTASGELLYRGDMNYQTMTHGIVSTE